MISWFIIGVVCLCDFYAFFLIYDQKANIMAEVVSASLHSLSNLPDNILLEIIAYLPVHCLGRLACVSQRFCKIVQDDMIWKRMFCKQYKVHYLFILCKVHNCNLF